MQFLLKVDKSIKKHLSSWRKQKGCHSNDNKTVPRQRSGSGNSIEMPVKKIGHKRVEQDGGVLPTTGFPRVSGMETSDKSDTVQTRASHTTCIRSRAASRGYTFEACILKWIKFIEGSSGSRRSRDGSGSSGTIGPRR